MKVSCQATGIRKDSYAKENRIQVEVEKEGEIKGQLLYDPEKAEPLFYRAKMKDQIQEVIRLSKEIENN